MSRARSSWVEDRKAPGQEDLAREAVTEHPEDLGADVGLQPVDGQDHAAGGGRHPPEPPGVRQGPGEQFVVAVQEVGDGAEAEGHAAAGEFGMDLGDAAVLGVPQGADQGDDVEPEIVFREGEVTLLLGSEWYAAARAERGSAAADLEPEPDHAAEGGDGPLGHIRRPRAARRRRGRSG
jgi:hypothetical protein